MVAEARAADHSRVILTKLLTKQVITTLVSHETNMGETELLLSCYQREPKLRSYTGLRYSCTAHSDALLPLDFPFGGDESLLSHLHRNHACLLLQPLFSLEREVL